MLLNRQRRVSVSLGRLEQFAQRLAGEAGVSSDRFAVVFVSDAQIARLNRRYRGTDQATDVLSFPAGNGELGDIVISVEAARRSARRAGHSLAAELKRLMVHGLLHLLGYDHETDRGQMARREHALRQTLGLG